MNLNTALYLVNVIDNINCSIGFVFVAGLIVLICMLGVDSCTESYHENAVKIMKKWWVLLILIIVSIPIPSKSTMYLMLGSTYLEQSNLPKKVTQALELKLDDYIKELKNENKK